MKPMPRPLWEVLFPVLVVCLMNCEISISKRDPAFWEPEI